MKKFTLGLMAFLMVISISGCSGASKKYEAHVTSYYSRFTGSDLMVIDEMGQAIETIQVGYIPSIELMQNHISDMVDVVKKINELEPPRKAQSSHDKLVYNMTSLTYIYNDIAMYLGTGQIGEATQAIDEATRTLRRCSDSYTRLKKDL